MHLSDAEKLILKMLCDIHERLEIENSVEPRFIRRAIDTQNEWGIARRYTGIPFEDRQAPPIVYEVQDILEMWRSIEESFDALPDSEKRMVDEAVSLSGHAPRFPGFGINTEANHSNVAVFLVKDLEEFSHFSERIPDAHMPTLEMHHRLLQVYKPLAEQRDDLSADQLISILKEQVYPDNR